MSSSQSGSRKRAKTGREPDTTSKTRKSSAYGSIFEQHLIDHGIYPEGYDDNEGLNEPFNLEEVNHRLAQPRPSLSPSHFTREAFLNFKQKNRQALTENTVMSTVFPIIAGTDDIPSQENLLFGNLKRPDLRAYGGCLKCSMSLRLRGHTSTNAAVTLECVTAFFISTSY